MGPTQAISLSLQENYAEPFCLLISLVWTSELHPGRWHPLTSLLSVMLYKFSSQDLAILPHEESSNCSTCTAWMRKSMSMYIISSIETRDNLANKATMVKSPSMYQCLNQHNRKTLPARAGTRLTIMQSDVQEWFNIAFLCISLIWLANWRVFIRRWRKRKAASKTHLQPHPLVTQNS